MEILPRNLILAIPKHMLRFFSINRPSFVGTFFESHDQIKRICVGHNYYSSNFLMNLAGLPPNNELGGTFFVKTEPAAIIELSPMVTPFITIT